MPETLEVDLNREAVHGVEAPPAFEVTGPFAISLRNHGEPSHVHLNIDGDLAAVAGLESANCYVERDGRVVEVDIGDADPPVSGRLEVVTGFGAERTSVEVTLVEPRPNSANVAVGAGSDAPRRPPTSDRTFDLGFGFPLGDVLVAAFGAGAVIALVAVVATVQDLLTAGLSVLVLAAGIAAAAYLLQS